MDISFPFHFFAFSWSRGKVCFKGLGGNSCFPSVLGIEPMILHIVGKCFITEYTSIPQILFIKC